MTKTQCPASTVFQFSLICVQCTPSEISSNLIPRDVVLRYDDIDRCFCVHPDKSGMTSTASGFITRQSAKVYVRFSTTTVAVANPKLDDVILIENKDIVEPDNKLNQIPSGNLISLGLKSSLLCASCVGGGQDFCFRDSTTDLLALFFIDSFHCFFCD